jgi:hypothetical protein
MIGGQIESVRQNSSIHHGCPAGSSIAPKEADMTFRLKSFATGAAFASALSLGVLSLGGGAYAQQIQTPAQPTAPAQPATPAQPGVTTATPATPAAPNPAAQGQSGQTRADAKKAEKKADEKKADAKKAEKKADEKKSDLRKADQKAKDTRKAVN